MSAAPTDNELEREAQGLPLTGYGAQYAVMRNLVLTVTKPTEARRFLAKLHASDWLDFGGKKTGWPDRAGVNIGFTCEGLRALGTPGEVLDLFRKKSPAFSDGAPVRAARYLGDAGVSGVERWNDVFHLRTAHVWIAINASDRQALDDTTNTLRTLDGASGLADWDSSRVPDGQQLLFDPQDRKKRYVHFRLRDNLTQPSILGLDARLPTGATPGVLPVGDLLLGYLNSQGANVWTPDGTARDLEDFVRNGTFGVLRQIEQNEASFNEFLNAQSAELIRRGYTFATSDYLKAKLCGRWPGGAPIQPHETREPRGWAPGNPDVDFTSDKEGWGCPFGAHIRRANPRTDPLMPVVQRTVFRRSIPYGPPYQGRADGIERGLVGVFFCSHIDEQFELLVSEWLEKNPLGPKNAGRVKDPLSGRHDEPDAAFHIPMPGGAGIVLKGFREFVRTRGTLYALFPSRRALQTLAVGREGRTR
jgi:deferrochelatase/peroxidase EfeB